LHDNLRPEHTAMFVDFTRRLLRSPRLPEGMAWERRAYQPGEELTREGEPGRWLFVVESGRFAAIACAQLPDGRTIDLTMAELAEGDVCGESALIADYARIATVRALTPASAIAIDGPKLSVYLDDHPVEGYLFFKYLLAVSVSNLATTNRGVIELDTIGLTLRGMETSGYPLPVERPSTPPSTPH
jgi:CRP-like cAMP-binding protein